MGLFWPLFYEEKSDIMNRVLVILFFAMSALCYSQSKDYNTKKGIAVSGYDLVSYFDGEPLEGNTDFTTTFDGVQYKFISKANMKKFIAHPSAYLPEYGGFCAYAMAVNGKKVNVNPKTFEIRDGKLYLFYDKGKNNTLQFWLNKSPNELRSKADKNWEKIRN